MKHGTYIDGVGNIETGDRLSIGLSTTGFAHSKDLTYLNIRGKLTLAGKYSFGSGCRIDVGPKGIINIGKGGYTNVNSRFVIETRLTIGDGCVISWDCQFLDSDYHELDYPGKRQSGNAGIKLGNKIWVGNGAKIYKGTVIPDGCVIAGDAVVKGIFTLENALIAGNPAKVVKENINWK